MHPATCFLVPLSLLSAMAPLAAQQDPPPPASTPAPAAPAAKKMELKAAEARLQAEWRNLGDKTDPDAREVQSKAATNLRESRQSAQKNLENAWHNFGNPPAAPAEPPRALVKPQALLARPPAPAAGVPFANPDEIRSAHGELRTTLHLVRARNTLDGVPVDLRSYNGKLVGPTLRARPGDVLRITLKNELAPELEFSGTMNTLHSFNVTNFHTHGLHVSPAGISDNVLLEVGPQSSQEYEIVIPADHPAGTFWYHAHRHGSTAAQLASGASGALIIDGGMDLVPALAKVPQRIFVLQQIPYFLPPPTQPGQQPVGVIEEQYKDSIFGPGTWDALGRFTTINGQRLPVLRMHPGSVERWRLIDSGIREAMYLRLKRVDKSGGTAPDILPLREIAVDGLPLGKIIQPDQIELWPGYRSDVLVKAPDQAGVEYILTDERPGQDKEHSQIARLIVEGDAAPMPLPEDRDLAPFRLKSLEAPQGTQNVVYGILLDGPGIKFTANNHQFDPNTARQLELGKTELWNLRSINQVGFPGGVSHPFHIHVNPFEVTSIKDRSGKETLTEPVWRDTIVLREGWQVQMRTQYTDFLGMFVHHCHILDHEDEGMMELVEIVAPPAKMANGGQAAVQPIRVSRPYPAPAWSLSDAAGQPHSLQDFRGQPTALFFFEGYECLRCVEQLSAFRSYAEAFAKQGIQLVGVSSRALPPGASDAGGEKSPITILADPDHTVFRRYGCFAEEPLHGLFLIDPNGLVQWQTVSVKPYLDLDNVLQEGRRLVAANPPAKPPLINMVVLPVAPPAAPATPPQIEVEVWNTPALTDDYLTWAPTPCRIRLAPGSNAPADLKVVLTNDPPQPVPPGRDQPLDGDLLFDASVAAGQTARSEQLALTLPRTGDWVPFVAAGKFPRASTMDKDAILQVHLDTPDGVVLHEHPTMVRIRKDHRKLTDHEQQRFLEALDYLQRGTVDANGDSRYMYFVKLHRAAAWGLRFGLPGVDYYWPDLAHKAPGFIAWHRAFLLEFEREIQKTYPDVALPYWILSEPSKLFTKDFLGYNDPLPVNGSQAAVFAPTNPLFGWTADIDGAVNEPIKRATTGRDPNGPNWRVSGGPFWTDAQLLGISKFSTYPLLGTGGGFAEAVESNPHNIGHNWTGPWMRNCATSPRDPIFWVFHTGFDRQWAAWQTKYYRFDPTGHDGSFCPLGTFANPGPVCGPATLPPDCNNAVSNPCVPITHHLNDPFWPWSGAFGQAATKNGSLPQADMAQPFLAPFPPSPIVGLWPAAPAKPTPADMIDYLGVNPGRVPMGFSYDDSPFPVRSPAVTMEAAPAAKPKPTDFEGLASSIRNKNETESVRGNALHALNTADSTRGTDESLRLLKAPAADSGDASAEAVEVLSRNLMFSSISEARRAEIMPALEAALQAPSPRTRSAALASLAAMGPSEMAEKAAADALRQPAGVTLAPAEAIGSLALMHVAGKNAAAIRPFLKSEDVAARTEAVLALTGDAASQETIEALLLDAHQPRGVRSAAIQSLLAGGGKSLAVLGKLAQDSQAEPALRGEAIAGLGVLVRSVKAKLSKEDLTRVIDVLSAIPPVEAERLGPIVGQTVFRATHLLK